MNAINFYFADDKLSSRDKVNILEEEMKKQSQIEIPIKHYFAHGVYGREMYVPKGVMLTGKIHKYTQLNILSKGEMSVVIDDEVVRMKAPFTFVAKAGSKRAFYAHEDSVWIITHGTHETDLDKIENYFVCETEKEYVEFCGQLALQLESI